MRQLILWFPDWPVRTHLGISPTTEMIAIARNNTVVACSAAARAQGVKRGQRIRLAQSLCPELHIVRADPERDRRAFVPVLRLLDDLVPDVQPFRPGLVALKARGVSRFYGGENEAATAFIASLEKNGYHDVRAGIADGAFAAEQAAKIASPLLVVPAGQSAAFLAPLPLSALGDDSVTALMEKLGIHRISDFAALPARDVLDRLGPTGLRLHTLASGADPRSFTAAAPEPELAREIEFESPLAQAEQVAFAVRQTADSIIDGLAERSLICTEIRIEITDDRDLVSARGWMHPSYFDASNLVDRVRWQLEVPAKSVLNAASENTGAGVVRVRITPTRTDDASRHQPSLFGQSTDERLHHALSRVQTLLGHQGVLTPSVGGGRRLNDRQQLHPWGDKQSQDRDPGEPWPGSLPSPLPAEVFADPLPITVLAADGLCPDVDERGILSAPPASVSGAAVSAWAGPWPLRERAWDTEKQRFAHRFQVVDDQQRAWLLLFEHNTWWAEARYR